MTVTPTSLVDAWCAYTVTVPWHNGTFYAGVCPLRQLHILPDAQQNSEWITHIKPGDPISVYVWLITDDRAQAQTIYGTHAPNAHCNMRGTAIESLTRVRCMETGVTYDSAAHAARSFGVTSQAMSQHLKRKPGSQRIKGATFERVK